RRTRALMSSLNRCGSSLTRVWNSSSAGGRLTDGSNVATAILDRLLHHLFSRIHFFLTLASRRLGIREELHQLPHHLRVVLDHRVMLLGCGPYPAHWGQVWSVAPFLGRAVLVDVLFQVFQGDPQESRPMNQSLARPSPIFGQSLAQLGKSLHLPLNPGISGRLSAL